MTYQFLVEDGSIVTGANSYTTVEWATDYLVQNIHVYPEWQAMTLDQQQNLLSWSSRYIDQRATWNGIPTSKSKGLGGSTNFVDTWAVPSSPTFPTAQPMRWPRVGARDIDGFCIPYNVIPLQLQAAVAEMARYLIDNDRSLERPQDFLTELKADNLTLRFRDATLSIVPPEVAYILRGLGTVSSGKTNFSKITRA